MSQVTRFLFLSKIMILSLYFLFQIYCACVSAGWSAVPTITDSAGLARANSSATSTFQGVVYIFGGESSYGFLDDLWKFDQTSQRWLSIPKSLSGVGGSLIWPAARSQHTLTFAFNEKGERNLVLIGGYSTRASTDNFKCDVWVYSMQANSWTQIPVDNAAPWPISRYNHAVFAKNLDIYMFGGRLTYGGQSSDLWKLDSAFKWTRIPVTSGTGTQPREGHTFNLINSLFGVIYGGNSNGVVMSDISLINLITGQVLSLSVNAQFLTSISRTDHVSAVIQNKLVVFGGRGSWGSSLSDLCIFDFGTSAWVSCTATNDPRSRMGSSAAALGLNSILVMHGVTDNPTNGDSPFLGDVWTYELDVATSSSVLTATFSPSDPIASKQPDTSTSRAVSSAALHNVSAPPSPKEVSSLARVAVASPSRNFASISQSISQSPSQVPSPQVPSQSRQIWNNVLSSVALPPSPLSIKYLLNFYDSSLATTEMSESTKDPIRDLGITTSIVFAPSISTKVNAPVSSQVKAGNTSISFLNSALLKIKNLYLVIMLVTLACGLAYAFIRYKKKRRDRKLQKQDAEDASPGRTDMISTVYSEASMSMRTINGDSNEAETDASVAAVVLRDFKQMTLGKDFEVGDLIVQGEYGQVSRAKAKNPQLKQYGEIIVVKEVSDPSQLAAQSFSQELLVIHTLGKNANIITFLGFSQEPKMILTRLYAGSLHGYMKNPRRRKDKTSFHRIFLGISSGLRHIHSRDVVHLDIRPENIMMDLLPAENYHVAVIGDFGLAQIIKPGMQVSIPRIRTSAIRYAAPEFLVENRKHEKAATKVINGRDVYSFGTVIYEVLNWKRPWN
eukprot:Partr_v1_DN28330_c0_g1_i2_m78477 putative Kelch domain containing